MKSSGIVFEAEKSMDVSPAVATTLDRSRYGNHLTNTNVTYTRLPSGLWAHVMNQATSNVVCGNVVKTGPVFTFLTWWKRLGPSTGGNNNSHTITARVNGGLTTLYVITDGSVNSPLVYIGGVGTWGNDAALSPAAWNLIGMAYDGAKIYTIGNTSVVSKAAAGVLDSGTTAFKMGKDGVNYIPNGMIALPRLFNVLLTPGQIFNLFERERSLFGL